MRKILLVSKFSDDAMQYTYASSFQKSLTKLGYQVELFNCKKNYIPCMKLPHDTLPQALKYVNNYIIQNQLKQKVEAFKPDLIFFIKAENIFYQTIRSIKQSTKSLLINFYPDNPFAFWNGNSNQQVLLSLPLYDYFLIWSKMLLPALNSAGSNQTIYFPFAYDEELFHQSITLSEQDHQHYSSDIVFIGTWDQEREAWLTKLVKARPTINLALWGNLWQTKLTNNNTLKSYFRGNAIYGIEMIKAFRCSKIVLNFIRQQNAASHNMRTFEALASNVFMLTQRTEEQTTAPFKEGENIECFETFDELIKKIEFYLKKDTLRKVVAQKGFETSKQFELTHQLASFFEQVSF